MEAGISWKMMFMNINYCFCLNVHVCKKELMAFSEIVEFNSLVDKLPKENGNQKESLRNISLGDLSITTARITAYQELSRVLRACFY